MEIKIKLFFNALLLLILPGIFFSTALHLKAQVITGSYKGNGTDNRIISGLSSRPGVVIIKGDTSQVAVMRTSSMMGDKTKPLVGSTGLKSNLIQSLDSNGFTVGNDSRVNKNGVDYYWIAFREVAGDMKVGSYTGDGTYNQDITGIGFMPEFVIVMSAERKPAVMRSSTMTLTYWFEGDGGASNCIISFDPDGFSVGSSSKANKNGVTYHYVAWNAAPEKMNVGWYWGNMVDNRTITGVGFEPCYLIIRKAAACNDAAHKSDSIGKTKDESMDFRASSNDSNEIQKLLPDGFEVGSDTQVNQNNTKIHWIAFSCTSETLIELAEYKAVNSDGNIRLEWTTKSEFATEGFNVLRGEEEFGEYVQINPYLILSKGTAGLGAKYSFTDYNVKKGITYYYLLEDIDIYGRRTLHGPVHVTLNDIRLLWPVNREILHHHYALFSWNSSDYSYFKIDISSSSVFPNSATLSFPQDEWTPRQSLQLGKNEWTVLLKTFRGQVNELYWKVRARSNDGRIVHSDAQRFVIKSYILPQKIHRKKIYFQPGQDIK